jgi:hypothetical protein
VTLTLGTLFYEFHTLTDQRDEPIRSAVKGSLERRWEDSDQDPLIAAVLLNPFYGYGPFNKRLRNFTKHNLRLLFNRLWKRFYKVEEAPLELWQSYENLLADWDNFEGTKETLRVLSDEAAKKVSWVLFQ